MKYLTDVCIPGSGCIKPPANVPTGNFTTFQTVIRNGIVILFIVAVILTLIFLIWGGIQWTMSGGEKEGLQKARLKLTYAIIGLVVVLLAFLIINFMGGLFGINLTGQ